MKISIAMCTYNGERFLGEQLNSFSRQTRLPDELVVCDDGSQDDTEVILKHFATGAPFEVRLFRNKKNLGFAKNFEKAVSLCRGDLIALSDQDDVWLPEKLAKFEKVFLTNPEIGCAFSDAANVDENLNALGSSLWDVCGLKTRIKSFYLPGEFTKLYRKPTSVYGSTMAIRRGIVDKIFPLPENMNHDFWLSFAASIIGGVFTIPDELIKYRVHSNQLVGAKTHSLSQRIIYSKENVRADYQNQAQRWELIKDILAGRQIYLNEIIRRDIDDKINHFEFRGGLPRSKFSRIPIILQELVKGRYHRYSSGFKSAIKDMIILK